MVLEPLEILLRKKFTTPQDELEPLSSIKVGSELFWKFSKLATDVRVDIHSTRLDGTNGPTAPSMTEPTIATMKVAIIPRWTVTSNRALVI